PGERVSARRGLAACAFGHTAMRVFVYEYTCAGVNQGLSASLCVEGRAMLRAVLEDLKRIPGVKPLTLLDAGEDEATPFRELARVADYTLVIAPEFDGLLKRRCSRVLEVGGRLLGTCP